MSSRTRHPLEVTRCYPPGNISERNTLRSRVRHSALAVLNARGEYSYLPADTVPEGPGICNPDQFCFVISILQMLYRTQTIWEELLRGDFMNDVDRMDLPGHTILAIALYQTFHALRQWTHASPDVTPLTFVHALASLDNSYEQYLRGQHDSHEAFIHIISSLSIFFSYDFKFY